MATLHAMLIATARLATYERVAPLALLVLLLLTLAGLP